MTAPITSQVLNLYFGSEGSFRFAPMGRRMERAGAAVVVTAIVIGWAVWRGRFAVVLLMRIIINRNAVQLRPFFCAVHWIVQFAVQSSAVRRGMRCGWIPVLVWGSAGMIARVPLNALLVLCFCVAQNVAIGTWDWEAGGRSSARADTCGELESLFHNAIVEDIMVEGRIVVRECVWRRRRMPNR